MGKHHKKPYVGDKIVRGGFEIFLPGVKRAVGHIVPESKRSAGKLFAEKRDASRDDINDWLATAYGHNAGLGVTKRFRKQEVAIAWIAEMSE